MSCDRAIRYSGFFSGSVQWVLLQISWIVGLLVAHSGIALFILLRVQKSGEKHPVEKLVNSPM